ncbi:MAG: carboxypeptidase-like regulatory domain-containing protein [Chthoniobacterales bacterium]
MNRLYLSLAVSLLAAPVLFGSVPTLNVTVSNTSGRVSFKGSTNANGAFSTSSLPSGDYVVLFKAQNAAQLKGKRYALTISAGKAKTMADSVAGEKFAQAGVAMRITIGVSAADTLRKHPELNNPAAERALKRMEAEGISNITGQVTPR